MIKRDNFDGIDNELFQTVRGLFEALSPRMIYHNNNDMFFEMEKRLFGNDKINVTIFCEFERNGEKVTIKLNDFSLEIIFFALEGFLDENCDTIAPDFQEMEIYQYTYVNSDGKPEVFEEGDFEYFSIKLHEIYSGIDIDKIILTKVA
jgi:hypothetical protein